MTAPKIWEENFRILTFHMDPKGEAHLTTIFNFLQEAASMHAQVAGFGFEGMMQRNQFWVLTRLKVVINQYPRWNDDLKLQTWSRGNDGIFYIRDFQIFDKLDNVIASATSSWAAINRKSRRPELVEGLEDTFTTISNEALNERLQKLPALQQSEVLRSHQVQFSDIDIVYHVNNVKYLEIIMNAFPLQHHKTKKARSVEINYLREANYGDDLVVNIDPEKNEDFSLLNIIRNSDEKEICRAKIEWH